MDEDGGVLEGDSLSSCASFVRTLFAVVHLVEPISRRSESASVEDHPHREVRVVQVEIERNRPHHDQTRVQMLDLPAHCATSASRGPALKKNKHRQTDLLETG